MNMKHDKFVAYWNSSGRPQLEALIGRHWCVLGKTRIFTEKDYRIAGDRHWELRRKWIEPDFMLPIERKSRDGRWYLTREPLEYDYAEYREVVTNYPRDWIEWNGGACPVAGKRVDVKHRDGDIFRGIYAGEIYSWLHYGRDGDIVAYRLAEDTEPAKDPGAHYRYEYQGIKLDPYRIADIYGITNHAQFSALKKILCAGERGHKDVWQDVADIKNACDRWLEMFTEDEKELLK